MTDAAFPNQSAHRKLDKRTLFSILGFHTDEKYKKAKTYCFEADPALRDFENIPLHQDVIEFFLREVQPFVSDAWIDMNGADEQDGSVGKIGYEINFNREFFRYQPPRALDAIDEELKRVEARILSLLQTVTT